jgi:tetratricopeptide (TPR) repeat protein
MVDVCVATDELVALLDGPEEPAARARLEEHCARCASCRQICVLAEREDRAALAIREHAPAGDPREVAENLGDLARALRCQGRVAEAVAFARRAVERAECAFGDEHPQLAHELLDLGVDLALQGSHREAGGLFQRAERILATQFGDGHPEVMVVRIAEADQLAMQSRWREAAARYEAAIQRLEGSPVLRRQDRIRAAAQLGRAYLALHQPRRALDRLERVAGELDDMRPDVRAAVELALSRALIDSGGDRTRAHELAAHARAVIDSLLRADREGPGPGAGPRIERWLVAHHLEDARSLVAEDAAR